MKSTPSPCPGNRYGPPLPTSAIVLMPPGVPVRGPGRWLLQVLAVAAFLAAAPLVSAEAQDRPMLDVLNVESSVQSEVTPDLVSVTLSALREGPDTAALTEDVENVIAHALTETKSVPVVQAATGGFATSSRLDAKGQRIAWQVRADLILKSREFAALSRLVGKLTSGAGGLQITNTAFELSPDLRQAEETALVERAITSFRAKAAQASKALGYTSFAVREITLGEVGTSGAGRMLPFARDAGAGAPALPLEAGRVSLQLRVTGSVQMRH